MGRQSDHQEAFEEGLIAAGGHHIVSTELFKACSGKDGLNEGAFAVADFKGVVALRIGRIPGVGESTRFDVIHFFKWIKRLFDRIENFRKRIFRNFVMYEKKSAMRRLNNSFSSDL